MKKRIAILLLAALTFAGCSAKTDAPTETTAPKAAEVIKNTTAPTEAETIPTEATQPVIEEIVTVPSEPVAPPVAEETPQQPADKETADSAKPEQTTSNTQPSSPSQEAPKPKPQNTPVSVAPARKVSSATCKDTGSNKLWEEPDIQWFDPYETTDTERIAYMNYLKDYGSSYGFQLQSYDIEMRVGRTYAIPLLTDADTFKSCIWVSSDPTVATVNSVGTVTPLAAGTTVITVMSTTSSAYAMCNCTVREVEEKEFHHYTLAELEQMAHQEAKKIAAYATENGTTDLEKIGIAASIINSYIEENHGGSYYGIAGDDLVSIMVPGYNQPFGTLVTFYSTCAGDTRALGLVLEYMGFEWFHEGENQWDHQWCVVYDVDGQTAFADGSYMGVVGYGERTNDVSNWRQYRDGSLQSIR